MGLNIVNNFANKLYSMLFNNIGLSTDQEQIVLYMLKLIIKYSCILTIIFVISTVLGVWWTTLTFILSFLAIRYSFGGWHSKNEYICFIISIFVSILAGYTSKIISINVTIYILIYLFALIIAIKVGVVDNPMKRLSVEKKKRFKKRGLVMLMVLFCTNTIFLALNFVSLSNAILLGILIGFVNLLFGR